MEVNVNARKFEQMDGPAPLACTRHGRKVGDSPEPLKRENGLVANAVEDLPRVTGVRADKKGLEVDKIAELSEPEWF
jgi:hypothetical protein